MPPRLLQLLPPRRLTPLHGETASLVQSAHDAATPDTLSKTLQRPLWDTFSLLSSNFENARVIHAVGQAVRSCFPARVPVIYTPDLSPRKGDLRALSLIAKRVPILAVTATPHAKSVLERSGLPFASIHLVSPSYRLPSARTGRDNELRSRLGFSADDHVVLASGTSTRQTNHILVLWALSILGFTSPRWKLLLIGTGPGIRRIEKFAADAGPANMVTLANQFDPTLTFSNLLQTADLVLDTSSHTTDARPLLEAIAAEVPLLATPSPASHAFLPQGLLVPNPTPRVVARKLLDLVESPAALQENLTLVQKAAGTLISADPVAQWARILGAL